MTTIMQPTKQAARKPMKMTMRRPIKDMQRKPTLPSLRATRSNPECVCGGSLDCFVAALLAMTGKQHSAPTKLVRHRHGAQRLAFPGGEFFGLRLQLAAGGENVAAARGAHRRGIARV